MSTQYNSESELTSTDMLIQMLTDKEYGEEATEAFFKAEFLVSAVDALFTARRKAGLTQSELANRLNTKQASIARLEADTTGSVSLRRYVEIALACGMIPLNITLAPINSARDYIIENPEGARTADAYTLWLQSKELQSSTTVASVQDHITTSSASFNLSFQNFVRDPKQNADTLFWQSSQNWSKRGNIASPTVTSEPITTSSSSISSKLLKEKVAV